MQETKSKQSFLLEVYIHSLERFFCIYLLGNKIELVSLLTFRENIYYFTFPEKLLSYFYLPANVSCEFAKSCPLFKFKFLSYIDRVATSA